IKKLRKVGATAIVAGTIEIGVMLGLGYALGRALGWTSLEAVFLVGDALELEALDRTFDTVIDCGLFHGFSDPERELYEASLRTVSHPGTVLHIMALSDWEDDWGGPRRVSQAELLDTFRSGWRCEDIREARFVTNFPRIRGHAWLATFVREAEKPKRRKPQARTVEPLRVASAPSVPLATAPA
ncbi:MAG: class I SAM-dependent methyltransferase, partial [Thermoplasmatota archaeon]